LLTLIIFSFRHADPSHHHHLILSLRKWIHFILFLTHFCSQRFILFLFFFIKKLHRIVTVIITRTAMTCSFFLFLSQYQDKPKPTSSKTESSQLQKPPSQPSLHPLFSKTHGTFCPWTSWFWEDGIRVPHLILSLGFESHHFR